jgi:thioesterase domain-containing protein
LFFLHGDFSGGGFYCHALARELGSDQPFYAVHPHGLGGSSIPDSIEAMAADLLPVVRSARPSGPYFLGGHCNGALIAVEMARQLLGERERVPLVVVIDAIAPRPGKGAPDTTTAAGDSPSQRGPKPTLVANAGLELNVFARYRLVTAAYAPARYPGRIAVLRSKGTPMSRPHLGWSAMSDEVESHTIPGDHHTSITRHVVATAARFRECLDAAIASDVRRSVEAAGSAGR